MSDPLSIDPTAQDILFRQARTANTFTDEPVSDEQVRAIYDLVKWAPTAMNTQPLRVVLVRSPEARERLVAHMADGNKAKTATAPLVAVLAADSDFHEHLPTVFPHRPGARDDLHGVPEARAKMAAFNGAIQVGYFIIGVRAAGLAAGPMAGFDAEGVAKEFFPEGGHQVLAVVNIGKPGPDAWFPRNPRLEYDQVVTTV
ncbi:malonic semialdehyde reductase [Actinoallomurus rhizosphaericola]|uniref:malonic semialdehyde reductase n=1 Tax=Actinoallomurus rhizosphaericola TaxID=2952536 RepID=UPI002091480A|nr:malonic semialdehyde reductase [Actinoallomurus rhizosphaericola]MCO5992336.1 malonic semialdehyde reductase [Actinoallomurus rhizosphaericola]